MLLVFCIYIADILKWIYLLIGLVKCLKKTEDIVVIVDIIITLKDINLSPQQQAQLYNVSKSVVSRAWNHYWQINNVNIRYGGGE